ncbi:MAG: M20/M25/M40 family metallo-hydrolase [Acidimicrobiia bacterium]|nr:M20/M25/M40 family metallo-hydrolase [Acidimicrobiia bacterium]
MVEATAAERQLQVAELAAMGEVRAALEWFGASKKWINERHLELCRIPAPTFQEQARGQWMAARLRELGCQVRVDRAGNVIAWMGRETAGPVLALTAHLDTVLAPRGAEEVTLGRDGRFLGPGVSDNGAGLAALLAVAGGVNATAELAVRNLPIVLIANVGEEGEGNLSGMRYLCRGNGIGARVHTFLVLDGPSSDHITHRALASRRFEISLTGPGGHSWSDYGVPNPVHAMGRAIAWFADNLPAAMNGGPRTSFNFGTIDGGTSVNSIPGSARAKVDLRSESAQRIEELTAMLTAAVERSLETENERATSGRLQARLREIGSRPGGQLDPAAPVLGCLRAVDAHLRIRSQLDCASTDANIPLSLGMHAVSIGAGGQGGGAHTPGEWYHPDGREVALQRILLTLLLLERHVSQLAG